MVFSQDWMSLFIKVFVIKNIHEIHVHHSTCTPFHAVVTVNYCHGHDGGKVWGFWAFFIINFPFSRRRLTERARQEKEARVRAAQRGSDRSEASAKIPARATTRRHWWRVRGAFLLMTSLVFVWWRQQGWWMFVFVLFQFRRIRCSSRTGISSFSGTTEWFSES